MLRFCLLLFLLAPHFLDQAPSTLPHCHDLWHRKVRNHKNVVYKRQHISCKSLTKLRFGNKTTYDKWWPEWYCEDVIRCGGEGGEMTDGPKWTCGLSTFQQRKAVLVYSLGSHGQTHWEWGVRRALPQAEIHIFDPTVWLTRAILKDLRKLNASLHEWWMLGSRDMKTFPESERQGQPAVTMYPPLLNDTLRHSLSAACGVGVWRVCLGGPTSDG
jgi:hypothetical protein